MFPDADFGIFQSICSAIKDGHIFVCKLHPTHRINNCLYSGVAILAELTTRLVT